MFDDVSRFGGSRPSVVARSLAMGVDMGKQMDDAIVSAEPGLPARPDLPRLDLPSGDNLATVRAADEWLGELSACLSYYADAARRVGHERTAELHERQLEAANSLRAELRRMWLGDDVRTHTVVDELRHSLAVLNYRVEQLLAGARPPGPGRILVEVELVGEPDEYGNYEVAFIAEDQHPWETRDQYLARTMDADTKAIVRSRCADAGQEPPSWAREA
jgi:hypothetical protein